MRGPLRRFATRPWAEQRPTWREAQPALIEAALKRASVKPSGNWFVLGPSRDVTAAAPVGRVVAGREVVVWRGPNGGLLAGPGACPHMGAPLCDAAVHRGRLVCRWHGLALGGRPLGTWSPYPAHDDGLLVWVRLDEVGGEEPLAEPVVPVRPPTPLDAVTTVVGRCEPEDVLANRLDPWHGAWFHPHSFANLTVRHTPTEDDDRFLVEVTFKVASRIGVPVLASFTCPEPRTVVMRIVAGEGAGSVVETHVTPLDDTPRTAVVEAVAAHSDRPGFTAARPLLRPLMRLASARLWRDDLAYAERRYALRTAGR
ncbi:MAG: Rieske (2Fe-2S) protein [Saccharothrix sp.]|nr:Rieske (2Fe-2S) protein [Saccharothrix sp.]